MKNNDIGVRIEKQLVIFISLSMKTEPLYKGVVLLLSNVRFHHLIHITFVSFLTFNVKCSGGLLDDYIVVPIQQLPIKWLWISTLSNLPQIIYIYSHSF